jgi:cysteine-rich repeat protein
MVSGCSGSLSRSQGDAAGASSLSGAGSSGAGHVSADGGFGNGGGGASAGQAASSSGGTSSAGQPSLVAGSGGAGLEVVDLVGTGCWPKDTRGCNGTNQRTRLLCVGEGNFPEWQAAGQCAENERCDNTEHVGECAPLLGECVGHEPYQGLCVGDIYVECGVDLVTRAYQEQCTDRCLPSPGGADCVQLGCGDGVESASEACDDGNNDNGDGCSAGCAWEPPHGQIERHSIFFGAPAVLSGDTIVVRGNGSLDSSDLDPALYVFRSSGLAWSLEAKLTPPPGASFNELALDGDTLAVEVLGDDADGAGAVFIFRRMGSVWSAPDKLVAMLPDGMLDRGDSQSFGRALSLTADALAVGAFGDDNQGDFSGAVYVFQRSGNSFAPAAKLVATSPEGAPEGLADGQFGYAVSLVGNTLAVGALQARGPGGNAGAAYVFERTGTAWSPSPQAKLLATLPSGASDATDAWDQFGWSVAVRGDLLVVGSRYDNEYSGSAYVFRRTGSQWNAEAHLLPPSTPASNASIGEFGAAVAISDSANLIAIGNPRRGVQGAYGGAIHVFSRQGSAWQRQTELLAMPRRGASLNVTAADFGDHIDMDGDRILSGAHSAEGSGRAYLFQPKASGWQTRLELRALEPRGGM